MWFTVEVMLVAYVVICCAIFIFQRHLMYHPVRTIDAPAAYNLTTVQDVVIDNDGIKRQIWIHPARPGFPTVVYFHGNAVHLGDRAFKFVGFVEAGLGLVAISYGGFGKSDGRPSEKNIYNDARIAIAYARDTLHVPQEKLIYFGESLGTGVAVQMATEQAPALLVLEAAYTSVETRSAELYPFVLGVRRLVRDKYDSLSKIKNVHAPLLMLHGELDPVIPLVHGKTLFAAANEPKQMVVYPGVHHFDFTPEQTIVPLLNEARKYGLLKQP